MPTFCRRDRYLIIVLVAYGYAAGFAPAQPRDQLPTTLADVKARVPPGDVIFVTNTNGVTITGKLVTITDDGVQVSVRSAARRVAATDGRRIQRQQQDSVLQGVLIGAAVGGAPGLYWLAADPNECSGLCPEEYAYIGIGAVVGGLIDYAIKKRVTVYTADTASRRGTDVRLGPVFTPARKGVQVAVTF